MANNTVNGGVSGEGHEKEIIIKEGWLKKQGRRGMVKSWKRRFFEMSSTRIRYFSQQKDGELLGTIPLIEIQKIVMDPELDTFCFRIDCATRYYNLIAYNEADMTSWIEETETARVQDRAAAKDLSKGILRVIKEGWLSKQGGRFKSWKRRWFVLTKTRLSYYLTPAEKEPIDTIPVEDIQVNIPKDMRKKRAEFKVQLITPYRTYEIVVDSGEEMDSWIASLKTAKMDEDSRRRRRTMTLSDVPVMKLISDGNEQAVKEMLEKGEDTNITVNGFTLLHHASLKNKTEIAKMLLEYGADVNRRSQIGLEPLHVAAENGSVGVAEVCLDKGAMIDSISEQMGRAPIHFAAFGGHTKVISLFAERKCDLNIKDENGYTALMLACENGHDKASKLLMGIRAANQIAVLAITQLQSDTNVKNKDGKTALHIAVEQQYSDLVTLLVKNNSNLESAENNGNRPLHFAAIKGSEGIARTLIKSGCQMSPQNNKGLSPLHLAVQSGGKDVCTFLTVSGADLNLQSKKGVSPLHLALERLKEEFFYNFAVLLVESGANVEVQNDKGMGALHIATSKGSDTMCAFLVKHKADPNGCSGRMKMTALHLAALHAYVKIISMLLINGATAAAKDNKGWTPLHYAAFAGSEESCQVLIEHKGDVNARDNKGHTPLHICWEKGRTDLAHFLVQRGAVVGQPANTDTTSNDIGVRSLTLPAGTLQAGPSVVPPMGQQQSQQQEMPIQQPIVQSPVAPVVTFTEPDNAFKQPVVAVTSLANQNADSNQQIRVSPKSVTSPTLSKTLEIQDPVPRSKTTAEYSGRGSIHEKEKEKERKEKEKEKERKEKEREAERKEKEKEAESDSGSEYTSSSGSTYSDYNSNESDEESDEDEEWSAVRNAQTYQKDEGKKKEKEDKSTTPKEKDSSPKKSALGPPTLTKIEPRGRGRGRSGGRR